MLFPYYSIELDSIQLVVMNDLYTRKRRYDNTQQNNNLKIYYRPL